MSEIVILGFAVAVVIGIMIVWRKWDQASTDRAKRPRY